MIRTPAHLFLLASQELLSDLPQHDEMLFIIIHQVYDCSYRSFMTNGMVVFINKDQPLPFIKSLKRATRIFDVLVHQIDILETMTPIEFDHFGRFSIWPAGFNRTSSGSLNTRLASETKRTCGITSPTR